MAKDPRRWIHLGRRFTLQKPTLRHTPFLRLSNTLSTEIFTSPADEKAAESPNKSSGNPKFSELEEIHEQIRRTFSKSLRIEYMTDVQAKSYQHLRERKDLVAIAPDRAGKTIAFLLPFAEERLKHRKEYWLSDSNRHVHMVLLTAAPIYSKALYQEISNVFSSMGPFLTVQHLHEDYHVSVEIRRLSKKIPTVLVTTPQRLLHHLQNTIVKQPRKKKRKGRKRKKVAFSTLLNLHTTTLVIDEADRVLKKFRNEVTSILEYLPAHPERHTVAMSKTHLPYPTLPKGLLKPDFKVIDCSDQEPITMDQSKGLKRRMKLRIRMEQSDLTEPQPKERASLKPLRIRMLPLYAVERAAVSETKAKEFEELLGQWFLEDKETVQLQPLYDLWRATLEHEVEGLHEQRERLRVLTMITMQKAYLDGHLSQIDFDDAIQEFVDSLDGTEHGSNVWENWIEDMKRVEESVKQAEVEEKKSRTHLWEKRKKGLKLPDPFEKWQKSLEGGDDSDTSSDSGSDDDFGSDDTDDSGSDSESE